MWQGNNVVIDLAVRRFYKSAHNGSYAVVWQGHDVFSDLAVKFCWVFLPYGLDWPCAGISLIYYLPSRLTLFFRKKMHFTNVGSMLVHRLQCWSDIKPIIDQHIVSWSNPSKHNATLIMNWCWPTVYDAGPTSNRRWVNDFSVLGLIHGAVVTEPYRVPRWWSSFSYWRPQLLPVVNAQGIHPLLAEC